MNPASSSQDQDKHQYQPVFDETRCVHDLAASARCEACADACPSGALALGEYALELNADACDGCALCVAACPQEAIDSKFGRADVASLRKDTTTFLACGQSGVAGDRQSMPCVHALSWRNALRLHRDGIRKLAVAVGDCDKCLPRRAQLGQTVKHVNEVLTSRNLPGLEVNYLADEQWEAAVRETPSKLEVLPRRRAFLRRFVDPAFVERETDEPATVASLLGASDLEGSVFPAVPSINPDRCDGCDACVRVCATGAITLVNESDRLHYRVDASRCTGCKLCVDVCQPGAVSVREWSKSSRQTVGLASQRCRACGVVYHAPRARTDNLCTICAKTNHHRNLFQIDPA